MIMSYELLAWSGALSKELVVLLKHFLGLQRTDLWPSEDGPLKVENCYLV